MYGGGMYGGGMGSGMMGAPGMTGMGGSMMPPGPQSSSWLMRGMTGPSFAPPAPAEAAANWANHAALASSKAQNALMDIEKIRADAIGQVGKFSMDADRVLAKVQTLSASALKELQQESQNVWHAYANGKAAVERMFQAAAQQAKAAHDLALSTTEGARTAKLAKTLKSASFGGEGKNRTTFADLGEVGGTSFGKFHHKSGKFHHKRDAPPPNAVMSGEPTGNPDLDAVLNLIREQMARLNGQPPHGDASGALKATSKHFKSASTAHSKHRMSAKVHKHGLRGKAGKAQAFQLMAKSTATTLLYDTATAIFAALKSANDLSDKMTMRHFDVERQILAELAKAQSAQVSAAQVAGRAELIAAKAAHYAQKMSQLARYSQNAAGQAMAAQMAQAMGFPVAARGVPSPLPPPDVDAEIPLPVVPGMPLQTAPGYGGYPSGGTFGGPSGGTFGGGGLFSRSTNYSPSYAGAPYPGGLPPNPSQMTIGNLGVLTMAFLPKHVRSKCWAECF